MRGESKQPEGRPGRAGVPAEPQGGVEGGWPAAAPPGRAWHVYILLCRDGSYYIGATSDLARRWEEHRTGRGGHYTRCNSAVRIVRVESFTSREAAEARERQLKGWTRKKKEALIAGNLELLKRL